MRLFVIYIAILLQSLTILANAKANSDFTVSVICPIPLLGTIIGGLTGAIAGKLLGEKLSHTDGLESHQKSEVKISLVDSPSKGKSPNVQKLQMSVNSAYERLIKASDC